MADKELYISLEPQEYRKNKSYVLSSQIDMLTCMKHIQKIKEIHAEKTRYKAVLYELVSSILFDIEKLQTKFPKVAKLPEKKEQKINPEVKIKLPKEPREQKEHINKSLSIEEELREIQARLKQLNG